MKPITVSQDGSSLLDYAVSKLSPEVFLHPIWLRFGRTEIPGSLDLINDLLSVARNLQDHDPSTTCQVLLICAVYQSQAGQHFNAHKSTQRALALAQRTGLFKETIWAIWGACAISVQQGNHEQAASHLVDLQAALNEQNEWILANFVDEVKQSLFQPVAGDTGKHFRSPRDRPFADLLTFIFNWLQHWGFSAQATASEFETTSTHPITNTIKKSTINQSFFSIQRWQGRWHTLMLAMRGELRLQWIQNETPRTTRLFSFWGSILSSLRLYLSNQSIDTQARDDIPQIPNPSVLPAQESPLARATVRKKKRVSRIKKTNRMQRAEKATTVMPVAIHMLGIFSMTIGELAVKIHPSRGLSLLKYLLLHHKQNIAREVLMETFWPDAEPETARNNLNVAMHSLRKALRTVIFLPVIVFEDGAYGLESSLQVWLDVEEFEKCVRAGQQLEARDQLTAAVTEYETAISLYQGDFLEQNPYEEWTVFDRERLRIAYLDTLDRLSQIYISQERYAACITVCQLILARDRCREDTHCLLMRCYGRQGQYHLALRQYQVCVEALRSELEVEPAPETTQLHDRIRRREQV